MKKIITSIFVVAFFTFFSGINTITSGNASAIFAPFSNQEQSKGDSVTNTTTNRIKPIDISDTEAVDSSKNKSRQASERREETKLKIAKKIAAIEEVIVGTQSTQNKAKSDTSISINTKLNKIHSDLRTFMDRQSIKTDKLAQIIYDEFNKLDSIKNKKKNTARQNSNKFGKSGNVNPNHVPTNIKKAREPIQYTIKGGEALSTIAENHFVDTYGDTPTKKNLYNYVNLAVQYNYIKNPGSLPAGKTIILPALPDDKSHLNRLQ